jgi:very-short-patch-repair endonuclease
MDLAALALVSLATQGQLTPRIVTAAGLRREWLSRGARTGDLHRLRPRVYALAPLPLLTRFVVTDKGVSPAYVAHARAVLLSLGPAAAGRGRTAAALRGWAMLVEPARTIDVVVRHGLHLRVPKDVKCAQARVLETEQIRPVDGAPMRVTTAARTVVDCALELPLVQAVVICDSALRAGEVNVDELAALARAIPGRRGAARMRRVLELCDPESGSVLESVLRVRMLLAGLSGFATQRVVRDRRGGYLRRVDFCFEAVLLIVEVDGQKWHPDPALDRRVDNRVVAAGWRVLRYTWADVVHDPQSVLAEIAEALQVGTESLHLGSFTGAAAA